MQQKNINNFKLTIYSYQFNEKKDKFEQRKLKKKLFNIYYFFK